MTASKRLRQLLESPRCEYLLEAHSALSATTAEAAGAPRLLASSPTPSATYGMRDNSNMTMTPIPARLENRTRPGTARKHSQGYHSRRQLNPRPARGT